MVNALLALAVALFAALLGSQAAAPTQVDRLREACLSTDMRRDAFERLFGPRDLTELIQVVREGEPEPQDWMIGYEDDGVQIVLSGKPEVRDVATDCGVLDPRPRSDWRADLAALAEELKMQPAVPVGLAGTTEARSWKASEGGLTVNYEVYRGGVVVRFAQSVSPR